MKVAAPSIAPMFRSETQLALLGQVFCGHPDQSLSDLARATGVSQPTISREVERLRRAGVVDVVDGKGRSRVVRPSETLPFRAELRRILAHTGGLIPLITGVLESEPLVLEAYVFGSWADRYHGVPGPFPNDIDVALITDATEFEMLLPWRDVQRELGIEINTRLFRPDDFDAATDPVFSTSKHVRVK